MFSLRLELIKPLKAAIGYAPYKKPGQKIVIDFDEPLDHFQKLHLTEGSTVIVFFGDISFVSRWGSNSRWMAAERKGALFDAGGNKTTEDALFPH